MTDFLMVESGIRQLYGRYGDALWRKDAAAFGECFTEDAVWKIAGMTLNGRAQIASQFETFLSNSEKVMMFIGIPVLDVAGGSATGRTHVTEYVKLLDGKAVRTLGVYYDRFAEKGGSWQFSWHHFNMYYYGPPDFSAPYYECREYGPPPGMPGPDDPTTQRNRS